MGKSQTNPRAKAWRQGRAGDEGAWVEKMLPWVISGGVHLGVVLVGLFVWYAAVQTVGGRAEQIIIPNAFADPSLAEHPGSPEGGGEGAGAGQEAAADKLRQVITSDGWSQNAAGGGGAVPLMGRVGGGEWRPEDPGRGISMSDRGSGMVSYGTPRGDGGGGPRSSFYGTGGNATRIVYLIDHTASMVDCFGSDGPFVAGTVKDEVRQSISKLVPLQYFAVLVFTGDKDGGTKTLGADALVRADPDNKQMVLNQLKKVVPDGGDTENEVIFVKAFREAFLLKPQLIYFLTDGDMSVNVLREVGKLNGDKAVKINTVMFTHNMASELTEVDKDRLARVTSLAQANGGVAKLMAVKDLK